jgi:hypothetical protein
MSIGSHLYFNYHLDFDGLSAERVLRDCVYRELGNMGIVHLSDYLEVIEGILRGILLSLGQRFVVLYFLDRSLHLTSLYVDCKDCLVSFYDKILDTVVAYVRRSVLSFEDYRTYFSFLSLSE